MKQPVALFLFLTVHQAFARPMDKAVVPEPPPACGTAATETPVNLPYLTGYAPGLGGVNGTCSGGASKGQGFHACRDTLHSYMNNPQVKYIHVAAQQEGGSARAWGCYAKTNALQLRGIHTKRECDIFAVMDRYARSQNAANLGGKSKVDVEVGKLDQFYYKLLGDKVAVAGGKLECIKRVRGVKNEEKPGGARQVRRDPAATAPHRTRAGG